MKILSKAILEWDDVQARNSRHYELDRESATEVLGQSPTYGHVT